MDNEFVISFEDFKFDLKFVDNEWIAVPFNEELEILIVENDDIKMEDDLELFNGYHLSLVNFEMFKQAIADVKTDETDILGEIEFVDSSK